MKPAAGALPSEGDSVICLSDDDDEDGGRRGVAESSAQAEERHSGSSGGAAAAAAAAATPLSRSSSGKGGDGGGLATKAAGNNITPSTPTQRVASPGMTSSTSTPTPRRAAIPAAAPPAFSRRESDGAAARQRSQARRRSSYVQTLLSTRGCVLVIDNLEVDVLPADVLGQLTRFCNNGERVHSVHIPPIYPELNRAVGYVVFFSKEFADAAAAFLTRNFVVSARGRPWIVNRCVQELNEEDFGFPTLSAYKGGAPDGSGDTGGLKIIAETQKAEYSAAKRRRLVFEQHRSQTQLMFQRHAQEEKDLEDNPDLSLYH